MRSPGHLDLRFLVVKGSGATRRYYWQPNAPLQALGHRTRRLAQDVAEPGRREAQAQLETDGMNRDLDRWRATGAAPAAGARPLGRLAAGTLGHLFETYRRSTLFTGLEPATRRQYAWCLGLLEEALGRDTPLGLLTKKKLQDFYRPERRSKPARANAMMRTLRLAWNAGPLLGIAVPANPAEEARLEGIAPTPRMWSPAAIAAMVAAADAAGWHSIGTAIGLNEWLGQREADMLALPRTLDARGDLVLTQAKTGASVVLPLAMLPAAMARRAAELQRQADRGVTHATFLLLHEATGQPWNPHTFRHVFAAIRAKAVAIASTPELGAELATCEFRHLRHTAVTRLGEAEVTDQDIAAITGHTPASVATILKHYLVKTRRRAANAFRRRLDAEKEQEGQG